MNLLDAIKRIFCETEHYLDVRMAGASTAVLPPSPWIQSK
ncbi:hypothetical protein SLEP1_g13641 [Rubroshorea leprosula]|uniref:Uncharacterized protein n=1 Tax=Rubroshorea leprosula TaxID=152421 RepID=A0AAV5IT24_9ROSI|nr:hypothetical protein SLEP1_g13641 [Rubroshorea leprosula]